MMSNAPKLVAGVTTVNVSRSKGGGESWHAQVASVLDAGIVLARDGANDPLSLSNGDEVEVLATGGDRARRSMGVVAGLSRAGIAVELRGGWQPVERREFPRMLACIPMRYRKVDPKTAKQVGTAIRSRITDRPTSRPSDVPFERSELAAVQARLQKIERTLELLTDLVLWAGSGQSPLTEREVVLSAAGLSFEPDDDMTYAPEDTLEVELLLPLRDPVRVRMLAKIVRLAADGGSNPRRVAATFEVIDESDRDEVSRYVFQIQRRNRDSIIR